METTFLFRDGKPAPEPTRECGRCKNVKPISEFYSRKRLCCICEQKRQNFRRRIRATWQKKKGVTADKIPDLTKQCRKCDEVKPLAEFSTHYGKATTLCKACAAAQMREYYARKSAGAMQQLPLKIEAPKAKDGDLPIEKVSTSKAGTKDGETRFTFIGNEHDLERIKALAYFERVGIKDILADAIKSHIKAKKRDLPRALAAYRKTKEAEKQTPKRSAWRRFFGFKN